MTDDRTVSADDFGASFKKFLDQVTTNAPTEEPFFKKQLSTHFSLNPQNLPIISQSFEKADHPNLQIAIDNYLTQPGCSHELFGVISTNEHMGVSLSQLVIDPKGGIPQPTVGPVQYLNTPIADDQLLPCVLSGLYLIRDNQKRLAILLRGANEFSWRSGVSIEVMAESRSLAEGFLTELRTNIRKRNVYRGKVVSLVQAEDRRSINVQFHRLPALNRSDIILPSGLLQIIERQAIGFSRVADKLQAAGQHLKRGMLLYGPPGTGKTLTAMYLASQMPDRTIILITGRGMGLIEKSCEMARLLQPATLILEDVDLIGEERTSESKGCNTVVLFELLNQMDGLNEDADILFMLTTNRPETLEPALASRPGRVDTAIEVPLPDATCRQRLFELYGKNLQFSQVNLEDYIQRTSGVSAAFIKELVRKAALFAAEEGSSVLINKHFDEALYELVDLGGNLTRSLLGTGKAFS